MKRLVFGVFLIAAVVTAAITVWERGAISESLSKPEDVTYPVTWVADGDTLQVMTYGKKEFVRLLGIDTPEVEGKLTAAECYGAEASMRAEELAVGSSVRLVSDSTQADRDVYNRLLRYVYLEDGRLLNELLLSEGYAREFTFKGQAYKKQIDFKKAEAVAKEAQLGLWKVCATP